MASVHLVVSFCTVVLSHYFGSIVGQNAVHLRQVTPWPRLAIRETVVVVREGDTLELHCESEEEPASGSIIEALFQAPGKQEMVCITNCTEKWDCREHINGTKCSRVHGNSNRVWSLAIPVRPIHDGFAVRCQYIEGANERKSNIIRIEVTVMKLMSTQLEGANSTGVAQSRTPYPVGPVEVWSTGVTGVQSQRVQFTCELRPKTAASPSVPPVVYWYRAPHDLVAIYGAIGESVPYDASTMVPIESTTIATNAGATAADSNGVWKASIALEPRPSNAGLVRCSHLSAPTELEDSLNKTFYVHYGYDSLVNDPSSLKLRAISAEDLFEKRVLLSYSSPAISFPPLALHWEAMRPAELRNAREPISSNEWENWEPLFSDDFNVETKRTSDAFGGSSVSSNLTVSLSPEMAGTQVRCVLSNRQFKLNFTSSPRTIDHSVLLGDSPLATEASNSSYTLANGVSLHLLLNGSNESLTIRAYYSHQPHRLMQTFSKFPDALQVGNYPNFSPSATHMFAILQQLAAAKNGTLLNVSDTGEITSHFQMFGGAETKLSVQVTRELLKDEEMYMYLERQMEQRLVRLQSELEELKAKLAAAQEYRNLTDWYLEPLENASLIIVGSRVSLSTTSSTSALECSVGSRGFPSWGRHQWTARVESASANGGSGVLLGVYISGSTFMLMEERHSFVLLNCSSGRVLFQGSWGNDTGVRCGGNSLIMIRVDADRRTLSFSTAFGSNSLSASENTNGSSSREVGLKVSSVEMEYVLLAVCLIERTDSVFVF